MKEIEKTKVQKAYEFSLDKLEKMGFIEIPIRSPDPQGYPLERWTWQERFQECRAYHDEKQSTIGIGLDCRLMLLVAVQRKVPLWIKKFYGSENEIGDNLREINRLYENQIKPKLVEMVPSIIELEEKTFETVVRRKGFKPLAYYFREQVGIKELDFNSLDKLMAELENILKMLQDYYYWAHIL